jgi:hypothetical protein
MAFIVNVQGSLGLIFRGQTHVHIHFHGSCSQDSSEGGECRVTHTTQVYALFPSFLFCI